MYRAPVCPRVRVHLHTTGLWTSQAGRPLGSWFLVPGSCAPLLPRIFKAILFGGAGVFQSAVISRNAENRWEDRAASSGSAVWKIEL